jgi:hypothetical protein
MKDVTEKEEGKKNRFLREILDLRRDYFQTYLPEQ